MDKGKLKDTSTSFIYLFINTDINTLFCPPPPHLSA